MKIKSHFAVDNLEFIERMLKSKESVIFLYYDKDKIVGMLEVNIPDDKQELKEFRLENYKKGIDLNEVAVCESTAVHKDYRGNGLQYYFIKRCEEVAKEKGYKYITGTVHPDNAYSCNNLKKLNYEFLDEVEVYYGRRYIVYKEI